MNNHYIKMLDNILPEGHFAYGNILAYWTIIQSLPDNSTIIECGNFKGRSICSISNLIKDKKLNVICIDNNESNTYKEYLDNINKYKIDDYILTIKDDIFDAINKITPQSIDLIYLDCFYDFNILNTLLKLIPRVLKNDRSIVSGPIHDGKLDDFNKLAKSFENYKTIELDKTSENTGLWYVYKTNINDT